jgi:hypothetical protein
MAFKRVPKGEKGSGPSRAFFWSNEEPGKTPKKLKLRKPIDRRPKG